MSCCRCCLCNIKMGEFFLASNASWTSVSSFTKMRLLDASVVFKDCSEKHRGFGKGRFALGVSAGMLWVSQHLFTQKSSFLSLLLNMVLSQICLKNRHTLIKTIQKTTELDGLLRYFSVKYFIESYAIFWAHVYLRSPGETGIPCCQILHMTPLGVPSVHGTQLVRGRSQKRLESEFRFKFRLLGTNYHMPGVLTAF